jgi:hypothetical protein
MPRLSVWTEKRNRINEESKNIGKETLNVR